MYIHFTGYVLKRGNFSEGNFVYALSTESKFFHEILNSYWTMLEKPTIYPPHRTHTYLMGVSDYYIRSGKPNTPVSFRLLPYKRIQYPFKYLGYSSYGYLLKNWI